MKHQERSEKRRRWVARKVRTARATGGVAHPRVVVFRSARHIYAQIIDKSGSRVLAAASTLEAEVRTNIKTGGNVEAAKLIGKRIAEKAKTAGITRVAFDRSGFKYHGRVKALADAAREAGLKF